MSGITKMSIPKLLPQVILSHMAKVESVKTLAATSDTPLVKELAESWLNMLADKNGNCMLEEILVRATGSSPKRLDKKCGADSEDGLWEAKPCKGSYTGHISDDTAMSLQRHQAIPFCVIGVATEDGRNIKWMLTTSYRVFDNARYAGIKERLLLPTGPEWPVELPVEPVARAALLAKLVKSHKPKMYVRSNPLPLKCLEPLKNDEYDLWVNPAFKDTADSVIKTLLARKLA
jgi:hypothetical protein